MQRQTGHHTLTFFRRESGDPRFACPFRQREQHPLRMTRQIVPGQADVVLACGRATARMARSDGGRDVSRLSDVTRRLRY